MRKEFIPGRLYRSTVTRTIVKCTSIKSPSAEHFSGIELSHENGGYPIGNESRYWATSRFEPIEMTQEPQMKKELAVGDKVRIKQFKKRPKHWNYDGNMDHLMGQLVKIRDVYNNGIKINGYSWHFELSDFEEIIISSNEPELDVIL